MQARNPQRILVIQTAFLGDLLLSIPLLRQTRKFWPDAKLILMCRRGLGGFLRELGLVDELLEIRKGDRASYAQAREQAGAVDLVLSPHSSFRTALWVWRLGAREQVGFRNLWSRWAYSKRSSAM